MSRAFCVSVTKTALGERGLQFLVAGCQLRLARERQAILNALKAESDRQLLELIRRRLALPLEKRMNFLRVRLSGGGSAL